MKLAKEVGVQHVVYSPVKIIRLRWKQMRLVMEKWLAVYRELSKPGKPVWRSGSWRLDKNFVDKYVTGPFLAICKDHKIQAKFCMQNLIETP